MKIDNDTGAGVVVDNAHNRIHEGKSFIASFKTPDGSPLGDNATLEFLIATRAKILHFTFQPGGNSDLEIEFFEDTTVTNNGTEVPVVGLNRERSIASQGDVYRGPTISSDGDLLLNEFTSWSTGVPQPRSTLEWHLKPNVNYLVRITNRAGATQPVSLIANWYQE